MLVMGKQLSNPCGLVGDAFASCEESGARSSGIPRCILTSHLIYNAVNLYNTVYIIILPRLFRLETPLSPSRSATPKAAGGEKAT